MENIFEEYRKKMDLQDLNDKEKADLELILNKIEEMLNGERKIEGKFTIPNEIILDLAKNILSEVCPNKNLLENWKKQLSSIIRIDGKIDEKLGNYLYQLYNNPNVSVGIHGTYHSKDFDNSDNNPYFKEGIKCKYGDARRTIAFQDRGYIHAHGNISFIDFLNYNYGQRTEWMTGKWRDKEGGGREFQGYVGKNGEMVVQDNYIVVIPKNMKSIEVVVDGKIDTKFILGTFRNLEWHNGCIESGNWDSFLGNSRFNLREIERLNEEYKEKPQEEVATSKLGQETIQEQQDKEHVQNKISIRELVRTLMSKLKNKKEERGE